MRTTRSYSQLGPNERDLLALHRAQGKSLRFIAGKLYRAPSTVSRELRRNGAPVHRGYYRPHPAQARAVLRRRAASRRRRLRDPVVRRYVTAKLRLRWSPELISGRLPFDRPGKRIRHEAIYQWIYSDAHPLARFLPKAHRQRRYRGYVKRQHRAPHIQGRVPISARPASVLSRRSAGHWEADTVGNRKSDAAFLVLHERKTRFTRLRKLRRRTAALVRRAAIAALAALPPALRRSITFDNGPENAEHLLINQRLGTRSYFCAPYHSWEKGSVENTIGVLRLFCPKKATLARFSTSRLRRMERWLNARPRKCLRFSLPAHLFGRERRRLRRLQRP